MAVLAIRGEQWREHTVAAYIEISQPQGLRGYQEHLERKDVFLHGRVSDSFTFIRRLVDIMPFSDSRRQ